MPYTFTYDWFSGNIPTFERCLGSFKDQPCNAVEIGTHEGRSATWLLTNILTHPDSRLTCLDIVEQPVLEANLVATGSRQKVNVKIGESHDMLETIPTGTLDFAYIDGSHWACDVLEDAILTFRRVRCGGIIGFDDYLWNDPQFNQNGVPKPAIDAFLANFAHKLDILEHGYQVWVRKTSN